MPGRALRAGEESVGQIKFFSSDPGAGWLLCDGNAVSKTSYPELVGLLDEGMAQVALPILSNTFGAFSFAVNGEVHLCKTRDAPLTSTSFAFSSDGVNFTDYTGVKTALVAKLTAQYGAAAYQVRSAFLIHDGTQYIWFMHVYAAATGNEHVYTLTATSPSGTWTVKGSHQTIGDDGSSWRGIINAGYISGTSTYWFIENSSGSLRYSTNLTTWSDTAISNTARIQAYWDGSQFIISRNGWEALYGSDPADLTTTSPTGFAIVKGVDGFFSISNTGSTYNIQKASTINGTYSSVSELLTIRGVGCSRVQNVMYHPLIGTIMQQGETAAPSYVSPANNTLLQTKKPGDPSSYRRLDTKANYPGINYQGVFDVVTVSGGFVALSPQSYGNGWGGAVYGTAIFRYGLMLPNIPPIGDGRAAYMRVYR